MSKRVTIIVIAVSLASLFLLAGGYVQEANQSDNISVLFILDNSGSMANNDPYNLRYSAARLFTSLLNEGDAVGAMIFANDAQMITQNFEAIQSQDGKTILADQFQPVTADGYTDVKAAFALAEEMLNASNSLPNEKVIIFLTDGEPEPLSPYPDYIKDTINQAKSLDIPVLSIALTQGASTEFLTNLSTQTGGQVLQADTALDLLDAFLQILGNLQDRTILGEGVVPSPNSVEIAIDPGLIPYTRQVSFIVSKNSLVSSTLIDPSGQTVSPSDPRVSFYQLEDPAFTIMTLESITGGGWTVNLEGNGDAQVRGILNASLRAEILSPTEFAEAGAPLLITTHVVEEDIDGRTNRVIGDASFYAEIIKPNGEIESLDRFYDDGSRGDEKASDGIYSREYINTEEPGTYNIKIMGTKDLVPVKDQISVTLIPFPEINILSPNAQRYNLGEQQEIPVEMAFVGGDNQGLDSGTPKVIITNEDGKKMEIALEPEGEKFANNFVPSSSGIHTIDFFVEDGLYKTLPYNHIKSLEFEVNIVPEINFDLTKSNLSLGKLERLEITKGIPLTLSVRSTVDHAVTLDARLEGLTGLTINSPAQVTVPANDEAALTLILKGSSGIDMGEQDGQLVLLSSEGVNLSGNVIPLSLNIFDPTITITNPMPLECSEPVGCFQWESQMTFETYSTSKRAELVTVELRESDNIALRDNEILIDPGAGETTITIANNNWIDKGEKQFGLILSPKREGVLLSNDPEDMSVSLVVPPILSRCRALIIWGSLAFFAVILMSRLMVRKIHKATRKPRVTGTLQYWAENSPDQIKEIDLTEDFNKTSLVIGSDPSCDISISGRGLENEHLILTAEKDQGEVTVKLTPLGVVYQGYSKVIGEIALYNEIRFKIGDLECRYLSDSGY